MNLDDYFTREKKVFAFGGSIITGLVLWLNHFIAFGSLQFFDSFPSHETTGLILILFGFGGIFTQMFDYSYPKWLRDKNNKKLINRIITNLSNRK